MTACSSDLVMMGMYGLISSGASVWGGGVLEKHMALNFLLSSFITPQVKDRLLLYQGIIWQDSVKLPILYWLEQWKRTTARASFSVRHSGGQKLWLVTRNVSYRYLSEEYVSGSVDTLTGGSAKCHLQTPTQLEHHPLHCTPIVQDLDAEAEEQNYRQHLLQI